MSCVILLGQRKKCETRNRFKKENSFWGFCYAFSSKYMENMTVSAAARVTSVKKIRSKWTFNTDFQVSFSQKSVKYNGFSRDAN